jgi:hypothetical protein
MPAASRLGRDFATDNGCGAGSNCIDCVPFGTVRRRESTTTCAAITLFIIASSRLRPSFSVAFHDYFNNRRKHRPEQARASPARFSAAAASRGTLVPILVVETVQKKWHCSCTRIIVCGGVEAVYVAGVVMMTRAARALL